MTATASPTPIQWLFDGFFYNAGPVTVTPSGGTAPYTYAWSIDDGVALSPTSATTSFRHGAAEITSTTASCNVTDAVGRTATTNTVTIFL